MLLITEKNIFVYKLFLSLNISDFSSFFCKNYNPSPPLPPPLKKLPLLFQQPPLKVEVQSSPPFWRFGRRFTPSGERGGCTMSPRESKHQLRKWSKKQTPDFKVPSDIDFDLSITLDTWYKTAPFLPNLWIMMSR